MPLISILLSTLWTGVSFFFRTVVVKFLVFTAIFVVLELFLPFIFSMIGSAADVQSGLITSASLIPPSVWFFIDAFRIDIGVPLILTAYATRFVIRRIPFIG